MSDSSPLRHLPTFLTTLALGGLLWWGHHTGWRLSRPTDVVPTVGHWCQEHQVPEDVCLLCRKDAAQAQTDQEPVHQRQEGEEVRFAQVASEDTLRWLGVAGHEVAEAAIAPRQQVSGETVHPPEAVQRLGTRCDGQVRDLLVRLGAPVTPGTVVAVVEASEVGRAKSALMMALASATLARQQAERIRATVAKGTAATTDLDEAEARVRLAEAAVFDAEQGLGNLGLAVRATELAGLPTAELAQRLRRLGLPEGYADGGSANLLPIVAPRAGVVTALPAVAGEALEAPATVVVVTDPRELWLSLPLSAAQALRVAPGQEVRFTTPEGANAPGQVISVAPSADGHTRLVTVWAALAHATPGLRAGLFGTATITTGPPVTAAIVPAGALAFDGDQAYVFVRRTPTIFRALPVRLLARDGDHVAVDRLRAGDVVAVGGTGVLFAAAFPERRGAGCTDGH